MMTVSLIKKGRHRIDDEGKCERDFVESDNDEDEELS